MTEYTNLELLFAGYFNQDWDFRASTWLEVVAQYIAEEPPENVRRATTELRQLLTAEHDDRKLEETVRSLGCDYFPGEDSISMRAWLRQLVERLEHQARPA
jgi:hypothetical protein